MQKSESNLAVPRQEAATHDANASRRCVVDSSRSTGFDCASRVFWYAQTGHLSTSTKDVCLRCIYCEHGHERELFTLRVKSLSRIKHLRLTDYSTASSSTLSSSTSINSLNNRLAFLSTSQWSSILVSEHLAYLRACRAHVFVRQ